MSNHQAWQTCWGQLEDDTWPANHLGTGSQVQQSGQSLRQSSLLQASTINTSFTAHLRGIILNLGLSFYKLPTEWTQKERGTFISVQTSFTSVKDLWANSSRFKPHPPLSRISGPIHLGSGLIHLGPDLQHLGQAPQDPFTLVQAWFISAMSLRSPITSAKHQVILNISANHKIARCSLEERCSFIRTG